MAHRAAADDPHVQNLHARLSELDEVFTRADPAYPLQLAARRLMLVLIHRRREHAIPQERVTRQRGAAQSAVSRLERQLDREAAMVNVRLTTTIAYARALHLRVALVDDAGQVLADDRTVVNATAGITRG